MSDAEQRRREALEVLPSEEAQALFNAAWHKVNQRAWLEAHEVCGLTGTLMYVGWADEPRAETAHHPDGSTTITINEGLVTFTDDVVNALFASERWRGEQEAMPLIGANDLLIRCYANWKAFFDGNQERLQIPALSCAMEGVSAMHRAAALCFIVFHEYGHAVLHRGREREPRQELESEADRWGFDVLLQLFRHDPVREFSDLVAGAFLGRFPRG